MSQQYELKLRNEKYRERYALVCGTLFKKPVLNYTQSGKALATMTISLYNGKDDQGNYRDSTFVDFTCWGELAERAAYKEAKTKIRAWGNIKHQSWNDKTTGKKITKIVFECVGFDEPPVNAEGQIINS
jgi:single-stranded DNA-binding protein